jgi:hypothetical protein
MRLLRSKLTYANVIATLALFLALTGGVVWAAQKIGAKQLKANSVTTGKIKKKAVTTSKLKDKAVTNAKLGESAVNFLKIAGGTNVIASASGTVGVNTATPETPIALPLGGTSAFTPAAGVTDVVNIEARGVNLTSVDPKKSCFATVEPMVNGLLFEVSSGFLFLSSGNTEEKPPTPILIDTESGPLGLAQPGTPQQLSFRVFGGKECAAGSQVSVFVTVTQFK